MVKTPNDALVLLRRQIVLPMTAVDGFRSLVGEVAGGPVRGSWWGHPKGGLMYDLANALHNSRDVLMAKLLDGKVTFIHRSLWPSLLRVVRDEGRRRSFVASLDPLAKRILAAVESAGRVEGEQLQLRWGVAAKSERRRFKDAAERLAQGMALLIHNEHTEQGHHASVLTSWDAWAPAPLRQAAKRLSLEAALERVRDVCGGRLYGLSPR